MSKKEADLGHLMVIKSASKMCLFSQKAVHSLILQNFLRKR